MIKQRSNIRYPLGRRIKRFSQRFPVSNLLRNYMIFIQHLYQIGRCTTAKPIRIHLAISKSVQQAERIIYVGRRPGEMIAVIIIFQFGKNLVTGQSHTCRQYIHVIIHLRQHFFFTDTADGRIRSIHTDVLNIIQFTKDAQLGKLGDAGEEHKTQIRIASFQRTIEIAHHIPKHRQILFFMDNIEKRGVVFINEDNNLTAGLMANATDKSGKTIIQGHFLIHFTVRFFISVQLNA